MKTIAVLLTVFNRKEKTIECLKRIYAQLPINGYKLDIYLTDDGSTDGTSEAISTLFPEVNIIYGNGNLFWNRGMYMAWQMAAKINYDYYLWLNDDTFVYSNMISALLKASNSKSDKAIIIGATQSTDHSKMTYGGRTNNGELIIPNGELSQIHYFNGNIVLIPKFVYDKLGNLDYYFTHSKGDFDYGLRANKKGIGLFQVGYYLGECDLHDYIDKWCNPKVPLLERLKVLNRPNGMPPKETYYFEKRHYGFTFALFHYFTIYLRCFFPKIWLYRIKKQNKEYGESEK